MRSVRVLSQRAPRETDRAEAKKREYVVSVQFGKWNFEGQMPEPTYMAKVNALLAPYGPDSGSGESYFKHGLSVLYCAFHTTNESRHEVQPHICASGAVLTWDGRLDNRAELISELRGSLTLTSSDVAIVAAAHEKWGRDCLAKLIGDWALSIWNPREHCVFLAKDPIGTKHLYYSFDDNQVIWSTILDPLILLSGKTFEVCEEYIASWLVTLFPAPHLTPYVGIHAVPPASVVLLKPGEHAVSKYWDFDPSKRIRYHTTPEYEEHFRSLIAIAVQRRLRSDRPVLAELSGGMDSSSIVCMADVVMAKGSADCPRLDTISWFDDSYDDLEPDTNELHWIRKVEEMRGRTGCHINFRETRTKETSQEWLSAEFPDDGFTATPIFKHSPDEFFKLYKGSIQAQGYRVILSGIGGDEATGGGMPLPTPELQDFLARARFFALARQLKAWALKMGRSRLSLLSEAVQGFLPCRVGSARETTAAPWFDDGFVHRNRTALQSYPFRVKLFGPLPSFQDNIEKLESNRKFVAYCGPLSDPPREIRYPYLDRDFLEFMYAIPREEIVRVGQRRSLMRRALVGLVPDELLNRKRKQFVVEKLRKSASPQWTSLSDLGDHTISSFLGIIDHDRLRAAFDKKWNGDSAAIQTLVRTLTIEFWLRHLTRKGVLSERPRGVTAAKESYITGVFRKHKFS
jgi:asparagine synthase (glutamine-hydrolysing)